MVILIVLKIVFFFHVYKFLRKGHALHYFILISASPSYNEFILGSTNIGNEEGGEHTQGEVDFTPTYTYYNWSKTT